VSELSAAVPAARRAETEQLFGLRKAWVDPEPGIEMVQLHHAVTAPGQEPDWEAGDTRVLTPSAASPVRTAVIEVPRQLEAAGSTCSTTSSSWSGAPSGAARRCSPRRSSPAR